MRFVRWALHGQLVSVESYPRYRRVYRTVDDKQLRFRRNRWWTSLQSADAQTKHELMRQRQEAAKKEREEAEKQRQKELQEQERVRRAEEEERLREEREERAEIAWQETQGRWAKAYARRAEPPSAGLAPSATAPGPATVPSSR
ncbi:hypothetical protein ACWCV5_10990 [Streptomyces tubercidicus]